MFSPSPFFLLVRRAIQVERPSPPLSVIKETVGEGRNISHGAYHTDVVPVFPESVPEFIRIWKYYQTSRPFVKDPVRLSFCWWYSTSLLTSSCTFCLSLCPVKRTRTSSISSFKYAASGYRMSTICPSGPKCSSSLSPFI